MIMIIKKYIQIVFTTSLFISLTWLMNSCGQKNDKPQEPVQAYCIDFNWGPGGINAFPAPGTWADADPEKQIQWYEDMGCNVVQTFAVSCNGYAWYKDAYAGEQPGLKHDFLTEMVRLGHQRGMKVFGYFCAGANTKWGLEHPDLSYGTPSDPHIPFTKEYLTYLGNSISDAVKKTGMDGFMVDWIWNPGPTMEPYPALKWLECEKQMYVELMGKDFPGVDNLTAEEIQTFRRKAIERCWNTIYTSAKTANPKCKIWVTCCQISSQDLVGSAIFKQADILMNEAGTIEEVEKIRPMVGESTQLMTCLALWNKQDPSKIVPSALKNDIALYGFTKPQTGFLLPPVSHYLSLPVDSFKGDDRNIAYLARVYNGLDFYKTIPEKK